MNPRRVVQPIPTYSRLPLYLLLAVLLAGPTGWLLFLLVGA